MTNISIDIVYNLLVLKKWRIYMEVYLDIVVFQNFIVDMFLLKITSKIMKLKITTKRLFVSSLLGGIYTVTSVIPALKFFSKVPFQIIMALFMIYLLLGKKPVKTNLKAATVFILLSVLLSGLCVLLILLNCNFSITSSKYLLLDNSIKNIIISLIIMYFLCDRIVSYFKDRTFVRNYIFNVSFEINRRVISFKGFLDTGNELREPITNLPCILVEKDILKDLQINKEDVYYVPYSAIGIKGKLEGIKIKGIKIESNEKKFKDVDAIICLCNETLSENREFNALLSRGII